MQKERGSNWVICQRCGFVYGNHQCHYEELTNAFVCSDCLDTINQQIYPVRVNENKVLPFAYYRPLVADVCTTNTAVVGEAVVGCMIVGDTTPPLNPYYIGQITL